MYVLVCKQAPIHRRKEADHSRLVDGRFNVQGNLLMRLVLGGSKMNRSLHPPARILNQRPDPWVQSHLPYRWSERHITLLRLRPWTWPPLCEWWVEGTTQGQGMRWVDCPGSVWGSTGGVSPPGSSLTVSCPFFRYRVSPLTRGFSFAFGSFRNPLVNPGRKQMILTNHQKANSSLTLRQEAASFPVLHFFT